MNLNKFAVGVIASLLIKRRLRRTSAHHRVGGPAEDGPDAARSHDDSVGRESANFHGSQIHGANAATDVAGIKDGGEKFPVLKFLHFAFGLVAPHLLVERVEELLTGGSAGESSAIVERASEATEIEQPLRGAVEGHAHAVEQIDDARRSIAHGLDRWLVPQEISTIDGVVKMLPGGIALALEVLGGVDPALSTDRVRALHRHDGEQFHLSAHLGNLDDRGESCQAAANHDDLWF